MTRRKHQVGKDDVSDTGLERKPGATAGAVDEAPRDAGEVSASDPITASGVAREERSDSNAAGLSADDPDAGEQRKKLYERGATLVSRID
jgi:hypothetical protein